MDNPWASSWNDETPSTKPIPPSWTPEHHHSRSLDGSQEVDISSPSWSTGTEIKWAEPSDIQGGLWSQTTDSGHLDAWGSETYKGISLGRVTPEPTHAEGEEEETIIPSPIHREEAPPISSAPVQEITITPRTPSPTLLPAPESPRLPPSPDAFGSFETASQIPVDDDDDPWSSSAPVFPVETGDVDQWGSAWTAPVAEQEDESSGKKLPDEWEVAKQRKEKMDRQVPPELLASILQQCKEISEDIWPDPAATTNEDDYIKNRHSGMDGVEGLSALINRLAPPTATLTPLTPFRQTFTAKSMAESIRLSRHLPLTRLSPMAQLMAAKGSTAWESSVKARVEVGGDGEDLVPVGWKALGAVKEKDEKDEGKGKKAGTSAGLLSFWGRKTATIASTAPDSKERSMSPIRPAAASVSASPRSSIDSMKLSHISKSPTTATPAASTSTIPLTIIPSTSSPDPTIVTAISSPHVQSSTVPNPFDQIQTEPAPPSAVSRFLNRFSRNPKPGPATNNSRRSLALSSDDLEFLSDFVPSASDEHDSDDMLGGLEGDGLSSISASPVPSKLPPLLAPPPKPSMSRPVSGLGVKSQGGDLDSFFSLSESGPSVMTATPLLHPPVSLTSSVLPIASPPLTSGSSRSSSASDNRPLSSFIIPPPSSRSPAVTPPPTTRSLFPKPISPPPQAQPLRPPPRSGSSSRTHTPKPSLIAPPNTSLLFNQFDDVDADNADDFSDFHSPPPMTTNAYPRSTTTSFYDSSFSPQSSKRPLFHEQPSISAKHAQHPSFDDFEDFMSSPSSPMRSPSPPSPPAKHTPLRHHNTIPPPLPKVTPPPTHQRKISVSFDFLGEVTKPSTTSTGISPVSTSPAGMNASSRPFTMNGTNGNGNGRFSPPPQPNFGASQSHMSFSSNLAQSSLPSFGSFAAAPAATSKPTPPTGGKGGLSAQDLSFFEGL